MFCRLKKSYYLCKKIENMTDKEKIELIMQEKGLNNTQFCNEVCIAPGTLSHIRSGRTEPSLNILRNVSQAFPDINPSWLFYDEGDMYRSSVQSPGTHGAVVAGSGGDGKTSDGSVDQQGADSFLVDAGARQGSAGTGSLASAAAVAIVSGVSGGPQVRSAAEGRKAETAAFSVQDIVAETLRQQAKPQQRRVVEVRIFFDDGTFETFGPQ